MKIMRIVLLLNITILMNCYAIDKFSYEDYIFLEEKEWYTSYGLNGNGKVKFLRVDKYDKILQMKWWNDSFNLRTNTGEGKILELGTNFEYSIEYRNNLNRMLYDCLTENLYSSMVDRISKINSDNSILGKWSFFNKDKLKFEYRELEWDDYVYLVYIGGSEIVDSTVSDNTFGWFLLKYEGNGIFRSDGAYEEDKYRLEIVANYKLVVDNSLLRFIPEYNYPNKNIDTYVIYSKDYKR